MRIGILGAANAVDYASSISGIADCELVGLFSPDAKRGKALARSLPTKFFASADKLLKASDCVILSLKEKRLETVERAAAAGIHILCDVPFASDTSQAKRIIDICQKNNVRLMSALPLRFSTVLGKAKEAISAGEVGKVVSVVSRYRVLQSEPSSAGVILQEGAHILDLLRWILQSEFSEIYAQAPGDSGKFAVISLLTHSGVIVSVDLCRFSPDVHLPSERSLWVKLVGTGGVVEADAFRQSVTVTGKEVARQFQWGDNPYGRMVESFLQCVERGVDFEAGVQDGLRATEIALSASRAAREGVPVAVS